MLFHRRIGMLASIIALAPALSGAVSYCQRVGPSTLYSEQQFNYCGVASVMMLDAQANNVCYADQAARQNQIAIGIGYCVRYPYSSAWCLKTCGVSTAQVKEAAFNATPYGWVYGEWTYVDKHEAAKGVTDTYSTYGHPVVIAGKTVASTTAGGHYYLVNGYRSQNASGGDCNPHTGYPNASITGFYILDSLWASPAYSDYVAKKALPPNTLVTDLDKFFSERWVPINGLYYSVEKGCYACWTYDDKVHPSTVVRTSY